MPIVDAGVPGDVNGQGNLFNALAYGKHSSASRNDSAVAKMITEEVRLERIFLAHRQMANLVQDLRISTLAPLMSPSKICLTFHLSCEDGDGADARLGSVPLQKCL